MSFSFSSLIRLIVLLALTATMLAVGLARLDPVRPERRTRCMTRFSNINEYFLDVADRIPRWLDSEDGKIGSHPPEDGDVLEAASCAPWVDEKGHGQVAGRWSSRTRNGSMSVSSDFGLARYTFPGSEMLDHVSTEIVPVGAALLVSGNSSPDLVRGRRRQALPLCLRARAIVEGDRPRGEAGHRSQASGLALQDAG